jgi:ATP-dependent Clp protease ATP-binding subunit ClpC
LTEKVRRRPYSVVLFDEVEKAHPDVMNMLLQILEEGRLTDSFGRHVDFRNTVIILTSNLGTDLLRKGGGLGFSGPAKGVHDYAAMKGRMLEEIKRVFKPEFLNRMDEVVVFRPLERADVVRILQIELQRIYDRLTARGLTIELSDAARDYLLEKGFDPSLGARPLRRAVQSLLEDPLAEEILRGDFSEGMTVYADRGETGLVFKALEPAVK